MGRGTNLARFILEETPTRDIFSLARGSRRPLIIEFAGTPNAGKDTLIQIVGDYLEDVHEYRVRVIDEAVKSSHVDNLVDCLYHTVALTVVRLFESRFENPGGYDLVFLLHGLRRGRVVNLSMLHLLNSSYLYVFEAYKEAFKTPIHLFDFTSRSDATVLAKARAVADLTLPAESAQLPFPELLDLYYSPETSFDTDIPTGQRFVSEAPTHPSAQLSLPWDTED